MSQEFNAYSQTEACGVLEIDYTTIVQLRQRGIIPYRVVGRLVSIDRAYIDNLARLLARTQRMSTDIVLLHLYWLWHNYHNPPQQYDRQQLQAHRASILRQCSDLVEAGQAYTNTALAKDLGIQQDRLYGWHAAGTIATLKFEHRYYTSRRYANHLTQIFSTWRTIYEAAERIGIPANTMANRVKQGDIPAIKCPDGLYRISPQTITALIDARPAPDTLSLQEAAAQLGVVPATLRKPVSQGIVRSVGFKATRRIPKAEVQRWKQRFNNLNEPFAWLQPLVVRGTTMPKLLPAKQTARLLGVTESTIHCWSTDGLLPFFPRSFTAGSVNIRLFVQLYIFGLRRYAGDTVTIKHASRYYQLCKQQNRIV